MHARSGVVEFPRLLLVLSSLVILCVGCKITFEAQTVVAPDGSVTRTTRYVTDDHTDKEKIEARYVLPHGGTWHTQEATRYDDALKKNVVETLHIYTASQQYAPGATIPSDYMRRGEKPDHVSRNEVRLITHDFVFTKTFDYEERFQDVASIEKFEAALRRLYLAYAEHLAAELSKELEGKVSLTQASEALHATFSPFVTKLMEGIRIEGGRFESSKVFREEFEPVFGSEEAIVAQIVKALPPSADDGAESWREAIAHAIKKTSDFLEREISEKKEFEDEEIFGVYGSFHFEEYQFKTTLSLSGKILESNATSQEGNTLTWEFEPKDFRWKDYVLHARSRITYPGRIALAGVAVLALLGAAAFLITKKDGKRVS